MTFAKFKQVLEQYAPHVCGAWMHDKERGRVEIIFDDGGKSYHYDGAYIAVLRKIGLNVFTADEVRQAQEHLQRAEQQHGKPGLFVKTIDNTTEINRLHALLAQMQQAIIL